MKKEYQKIYHWNGHEGTAEEIAKLAGVAQETVYITASGICNLRKHEVVEVGINRKVYRAYNSKEEYIGTTDELAKMLYYSPATIENGWRYRKKGRKCGSYNIELIGDKIEYYKGFEPLQEETWK